PLALEIDDAGGRMVRTVAAGAGTGQRGGGGRGEAVGEPDDPDMRAGRGRVGAAASLTSKPGHNRFLWDYRWANGGPLAAPGKYTARLKTGGGEDTRTFE